MGLTYAFLYMGRYNLTVSKNALGEAMTKEDFATIFAAGTFTYAFAFLLNGPLVDKMGGRRGMLVGALGSAICNLAMGLYIQFVLLAGGGDSQMLVPIFSVVYAVNMYFQSFGAVSIVKVNAHWFHVNERGGFSGIFGTMISAGLFFAFTVNGWVLDAVSDPAAASQMPYTMWVFYLPSAILFGMFFIESFLLRDTPAQAGLQDFDTGDASSGDMGADIPILSIMKKVVTNPIILTVALIEFCTGVLRNGVMHWFPFYAKEVFVLPSSHYLVNGNWGQWHLIVIPFVLAAVFFYLASRSKGKKLAWYSVSGGLLFLAPFMQGGWGGILMVAGVIGANVAGWVSDLFFQSRRAPAAGGLYFGLIFVAIAMVFLLGGTTATVEWAAEDEKAAELGLDQLLADDEVLAIAGNSEVDDWSDVATSVACLKATCLDSEWDAKRCICSKKPKETNDEPAYAENFIPATVIRNGANMELKLRNPGVELRAGDKRKLKAGPALTLSPYWLGLVIFLMSLCVIGSHGLLSGTATMDFGGRRGAATAVGMIDGFVYLGTGLQSVALGFLTTKSWTYWPLFLVPFAIAGFLMSLRIWKAKPSSGGGGH